MESHIFREYDIRGTVGRDLTLEVVRLIGLGFGTLMQNQGGTVASVGRDNRLSSEELKDALVEGIRATGCNVIDVGLVPTPLLYFSLHYLPVHGGMMITGSHNPPEFNGFKVCVGKNTLFGPEIQDLRRLIESGNFRQGSGSYGKAEVMGPYLSEVKKRAHLERPISVVIDSGNGTGGLVAPTLLRDLGCTVHDLFSTPDGHYPHHHPDPTIPENLSELRRQVIATRSEIGIGYDGDADRIGVVDNEGNILWGDQLMILFSRDLLSRHPGAAVVFEVKSSQTLVDDIRKHGGTPIMWAAGHSLIKKKMRDENALLGGEMSGHIFFAENYYGFDDAIFASCRLLEILSRERRSLKEMLADVPKTYSTPEIRIACPEEDKFRIVAEVTRNFAARYPVIDVDGVRVLFEDGWGLVRASNTQPVLVLRFEAMDKKRLGEIQALVLEQLEKYPILGKEISRLRSS